MFAFTLAVNKGPDRPEMMTVTKAPPKVVAHIGIRGVPANYGGSEHAVECLLDELRDRGWHSVVYCRSGHYPHRARQYRGTDVVYLPAPRSKNLETIIHSLLASVHAALVLRPDLIHYHGRGNAVFQPLVRLFGIRTVLWVDGLEWHRAKWGWFARFFHKQIADRVALVYARSLAADSPAVLEYYRTRYGLEVACVRYGADDVRDALDHQLLAELGLRTGEYCVFVGRLTPEKNVETLLTAYRLIPTQWPLVIVGDNPYDSQYVGKLKALADERVRFLGPRYGTIYRSLLAGAAVSLHPSRIEGTSPALITALASGRAAVVSDIKENVLAAGEGAVYFPPDDPYKLAARIQELLADPDLREEYGRRAERWARDRYSWSAVADAWVGLYDRQNDGTSP